MLLRPSRLAPAALAIVAILASLSTPASAGEKVDPSSVLIQAHRGGPELGAPENSLRLFRLAVASGVVDRIETDVRVTKDGVLVIHHDEKLGARCGPSRARIRSTTWKDLARVRCDGEPVPRLDEVLAVVRGTPVSLNLELKVDSTMSSADKSTFARRVAESAVAAGLRKGQVLISSYYWRSFAGAVQKYGRGIEMTAMELSARSEPTDAVFSAVQRAKALGVDRFSLSMATAHHDLLHYVRAVGGMQIGLGDRRDEADTRFALAHGLRTFTSDDPRAARRSVDALLERVRRTPLDLRLTETPLAPTTVMSRRTMKASTKVFPLVVAPDRLPPEAVRRLEDVSFEVTVTGKGRGELEVAPSGSRVGQDGTRVAIPRGTRTFTVRSGPGDRGKIRLRATADATVSVRMTGFRTATY